ncbi:RNA polymerase sigma factor SigI [Phosphitispora fastidiosa]|uniref:RNA polymerase sigma factor SigI n=1 Tax=Phosphitispora fastidiosa TaxID=2837202 RepID=UPI001E3EDC66|nr:RNA polymerase sigma factor SigI [Phosphitispora fastidiosa]MBU7007863.1 RNA polymerase sigma factor [Phosphitispora fastidiosa]
MGFLFQKRTSQGEAEDCGTLVLEVQKGNGMARERLLRSYTPFILKTVSKVSGRYVRMGEDDEVSVGLMAFNEAMDCFDTTKNISFISFAETVIKRRLIDYFRKESTVSKRTVPMSSFEQADDDNVEGIHYYLEAKQSIEEHQAQNIAADRKEEIIIFTKKLADFGISFQELVQVSPKHEDARIRAMEVAGIIANNADLAAHLLSKRELPLKQLEKSVDISRKTLERQRKYIIAITLILMNDFEYLREYITKAL